MLHIYIWGLILNQNDVSIKLLIFISISMNYYKPSSNQFGPFKVESQII